MDNDLIATLTYFLCLAVFWGVVGGIVLYVALLTAYCLHRLQCAIGRVTDRLFCWLKGKPKTTGVQVHVTGHSEAEPRLTAAIRAVISAELRTGGMLYKWAKRPYD